MLFFRRVLAVIRKYGLIFIQDIIYLNDLKDSLFNYVFTFILIVNIQILVSQSRYRYFILH